MIQGEKTESKVYLRVMGVRNMTGKETRAGWKKELIPKQSGSETRKSNQCRLQKVLRCLQN